MITSGDMERIIIIMPSALGQASITSVRGPDIEYRNSLDASGDLGSLIDDGHPAAGPPGLSGTAPGTGADNAGQIPD